MARGGVRDCLLWGIAVATDLEAIAVAMLFELGSIAVIHGPAVLKAHDFSGGDAVVAVIAIKPSPTAAENIISGAFRRVATEAVDIAPAGILGGVVVVVIGSEFSEERRADREQVAAGQLGDFALVAEGCAHDFRVVAELFVVVVNLRDGDDAGIFRRSVVLLRAGLEPVENTTDEG